MPTGEKNRPAMNDRREGIVRDPVVYKGSEIVSYVKDVGNGDPGYDANVRQVVIMKQDGSEHVVPEADILKETARAIEEMHTLDRRPELTLPKSVEGYDDPGYTPGMNRQARAAPQDRQATAKSTEFHKAPTPAKPAAARPAAPATHRTTTHGGVTGGHSR